jgi:FkbM family methyltransferase
VSVYTISSRGEGNTTVDASTSRDVRIVGKPLSSLLRRYYRSGDHLSKVRIWNLIRKFQNHARLTIRYGESGWLTVDERCFLQRNILRSGFYEREVYESLLACAAEREVIWDIGANIGSFAVLARQHRGVDRLVCVEPDALNREILNINLSLNKGAQYHVCALALSDRPERRRLWLAPPSNRGMSRLTTEVDAADVDYVTCETLDRLVFDQKLPPPTLLKIDVEGWEYQVLLGASRLMRTSPPTAIVFETRCTDGGEIVDSRIPEFLAAFGYRVWRLERPVASVDAMENFIATRRRL